MKLDYDMSADELKLIGNYLKNELSPEQRVAFNDKMKSDINWTHKIEEATLLLTGIAEISLKSKLDSFHAGIKTKRQINGTPKSFFRLDSRWMVAASLFIVISVAAWLLLTGKNQFEKLYSRYYTVEPGLMTAMSVTDNYFFEKGMVDYKNGEYKKAITAWDSLFVKNPSNDTLQYFLGAAWQAIGDDDMAKRYLQPIVYNGNHIFYKDACWYLGLLLLKKKQTATAKDYLRKSSHPDAPALLDAINKNE